MRRPKLRDEIPRLRSARTLGSAAAISVATRVIGLLSQAYALAAFGAGAELDALLISLIVPNLVVVPYASAVEVGWGPYYTRARLGPQDLLPSIRGTILRRVGVTGLAMAGLLLVARPALVRISAPGAGRAVYERAAELAWWTYPSATATALTAGCSAILFASGRLQAPLVAQAIRPVSLIAAVAIGGSTQAMAIGVLVGSALETAANILMVRMSEGRVDWLRRSGAPKPAFPGTTRSLTLASAVSQAAPAVDQAIVASLGPGALVVYSLGSRFYDIGKSALVQPSARMAQKRLASVDPTDGSLRRQLRAEIRRAVLVGGGAAATIAIIGPTVILTVFRRGEFTTADASTASLLALGLAAGLLPWSVATVLSRTLAIQRRSEASLAIAVGFLIVNVALDLVLSRAFGVYGVALSTVGAVSGLAALQYLVVRRSEPSSGAAPTLEHEQRPEATGDTGPPVIEPLQ